VDPGFQAKGADLKKLRRAEGGANIFGVFRVKNHVFTPQIIFFLIQLISIVDSANGVRKLHF
jgi:hypothetical protein